MTSRRISRSGARRPPGSARRNPRGAAKRGRWLLLAGVAVCALAGGFFVARPLWRDHGRAQEQAKPSAEAPSQPAERPLAVSEPSPPNPVPPEPKPVPPEPEPLPPEPAAPLGEPEPPAAVELTEEGLKQEAIEAVDRLVKDYPSSPDPLGLMGDLHVSLGNTAEAIKCWEKCVELDPQSAEAFRRMAELALRKGQFEEAAALSRKVLKIDPNRRGVHNQLARALKGLGRPEEAIEELDKDIKISPRASLSFFLLGHTHQQLREYEKAKESYLRALQIEPDYTEASYGLSIVCARMGQKDEAAKYREMFKRLKADDWKGLSDPRDSFDQSRFLASLARGVAETHTKVGLVYQQHGDESKAEKIWRRAAVLDPAHVVCREELASFYARNHRDPEALRVCEQLRRIVPNNAQYHLNTGILYARMNRIDEARSAVRRAMELDPENANVRRMYQQMQQGR